MTPTPCPQGEVGDDNDAPSPGPSRQQRCQPRVLKVKLAMMPLKPPRQRRHQPQGLKATTMTPPAPGPQGDDNTHNPPPPPPPPHHNADTRPHTPRRGG